MSERPANWQAVVCFTCASFSKCAKIPCHYRSVSQEMKIDKIEIGNDHAPYVIAEISANHNGEIEDAKKLIRIARKAGASAVKIQTYTADTLTIDCKKDDFLIKKGLWKGKTLHQLYSEAYTPWEWHEELFAEAARNSITIFSSPFDHTAVDLLEELGAPAYKIASFEIVDIPLIRKAASTGKPMIVSTGMANLEEISDAVAAARQAGCKDLALLHCVSGYPAPADEYNLSTIEKLRSEFGCVVGLSDHTLDNVTAISSVGYGASIVEKHFTLDRSRGGPDDSFSLEPGDLECLCRDVKTAWEARGKVNFARTNAESSNVIFRRSLYVVEDVRKGEPLSERNIRSIRPGYGLPPKHYDEMLGRVAARDLSFGSPLSWDDVE